MEVLQRAYGNLFNRYNAVQQRIDSREIELQKERAELEEIREKMIIISKGIKVLENSEN